MDTNQRPYKLVDVDDMMFGLVDAREIWLCQNFHGMYHNFLGMCHDFIGMCHNVLGMCHDYFLGMCHDFIRMNQNFSIGLDLPNEAHPTLKGANQFEGGFLGHHLGSLLNYAVLPGGAEVLGDLGRVHHEAVGRTLHFHVGHSAGFDGHIKSDEVSWEESKIGVRRKSDWVRDGPRDCFR